MSLIEPLLPKEKVEDRKLENYFSDPLSNLEKSIENLPAEYESFEFDAISGFENGYVWYNSVPNRKFITEISFENKLVIGRIDGVIKIYDLDSKEEISLKGHTNAINCLQVCAKYDFLVSGSEDKTIIIWNLESYTQTRVFKTPEEVFCLAVDYNYNLFSISFNEKIVRKWNFKDNNEEASTISGHEGNITCIKVSNSPSNNFLATGSEDHSLRIWSTENNKELAVLRGHQGAINEIIFSKDDKYMVSGSDTNDLIIWNNFHMKWQIVKKIEGTKHEHTFFMDFISDTECMWIKEYNYDNDAMMETYNILTKESRKLIRDIWTLGYSKETNLVYYSGFRHKSYIIDTKNFLMVPFYSFEWSVVKMLIVGHQDKYLASFMGNGKIIIHKLSKVSLQEEVTLKFSEPGNDLRLTRDGKYLLEFSCKLLKIWSFIEKKWFFSIEESILNLQVSHDDKYFVYFNQDSSALCVYSFQDMRNATKFELQDVWKSFCFTISKDSRFIVAGITAGALTVFDIENKIKVSTLEGGNSKIKLLQINKFNEYFISADKYNNLIFWDFSEKKILKSCHFDKKIKFLKLCEKYNCVIVGFDYFIEIWNFHEKVKLITIQESQEFLSLLEVTEDEKCLIFAHQDIKIWIWSLEHMKEIDTISYGGELVVCSLDIIRDGKYIAIADFQKSAKLWSFEEKRFIATFELNKMVECSAKFSSDGKHIIFYNSEEIKIQNIEDYFNDFRIDSCPYFLGEYDNVLIKRFLDFVKKPIQELWDKSLLKVVVYPIRYNILHLLCITDSVEFLSIALKEGGEIFRDNQNMSPLSYALMRRSRRCIDEILNYVINLEDGKKQFYCIHQLRDDIPLLFNTKSRHLVPLLEILLRKRANEDIIGFYEVKDELPMTIFSPVSKIYTRDFTRENDNAKNNPTKKNENIIQFWSSPYGYNYTAGSEESLLLLKKMDECENQEIFQTLFVQSVIREKWEYLWPAVIIISIIYWLNLITMVWLMFDPSIYILISFTMLNGILAFYEFLQFIVMPKDYVSDIWNLVDFIRMALSIIWAIFEFYDKNIEGLSFAVVFFNFLRGLTYFRAFDYTRLYVRLILMAISDSFAFLIIFLYSTLAFGILYASLDLNLSFSSMWAMAYELNMGNFENGGFSFLQYSCFILATLINVVMMLNLLVSTLGDTFDRFQMIIDELDCKEMLQFVIEVESIMFWARSDQAKLANKGKLMYVQRCDIFQENSVSDKWQGKIKELSLKIDGVNDNVFGIKQNVSEELKKLEGNFESIIDEKVMKSQKIMNEEIANLERKVGLLEPKINGVMEMLETIKAKLES